MEVTEDTSLQGLVQIQDRLIMDQYLDLATVVAVDFTDRVLDQVMVVVEEAVDFIDLDRAMAVGGNKIRS